MTKNKKKRIKKKSANKRVRPEMTIGFIKHDDHIFYFQKDFLINQLDRESNKIAKSFDRICREDMNEISEQFSYVIMYLQTMIIDEDIQEWESVSAAMLLNACNSFVASASLLRSGHRLQPGIVIRSIFETITSVLHLFSIPEDVEDFKKGKISSTKTLAAAKQIIPPLGRTYGFFSSGFTHISSLHLVPQPIIPYNDPKEYPLVLNMSFLRLSIWLLYVVTELVCFEKIERHRYWQPVAGEGRKITYSPSEEELTWMDHFLEIPDVE